MAEHSGQGSQKHPLVDAVRLLIGEAVDNTSTMLERSALTRALAKAIFSQHSAEQPPGTQAPSWRQRVDEARKAHALLDGFFAGGRRWVHIERWTNDGVNVGAASTLRARAPKPPNKPEAPSAPTERSADPTLDRTGAPSAESANATPSPASPRPAREASTEPKLFGRYLHSRGLITLSQLIAAVVWQRKTRPSVGQIAIERNLLTIADVVDVLRQRAPGELFLEAAVRCGLIDPEERLAILREQRSLQKRIGTYFVDHGILTRAMVDKLAEEARVESESPTAG